MSLSELNMDSVYKLYLIREKTHKSLLTSFNNGNIDNYVKLALGITNKSGNYSSFEHNLGYKILEKNTEEQVYKLAKKIFKLHSVNYIPITIYNENLQYLKISVGSEMGMMLRPNEFWVGNTRTIFCHLLIKNNFNYKLSKEQLSSFKEPEGEIRPSEVDYKIWKDLYLRLEPSLDQLYNLSIEESKKQNSKIGAYKHMWIDAICTSLYK